MEAYQKKHKNVPTYWEPQEGPQSDFVASTEMGIFEVLYGGAKGGGKGQPLSQPVLTPFGYVPMGSLKIGSQVCNPSGCVSEVIGIYPLGKRKIFRVTFSDGTSTRVTDDHLWLVHIVGTHYKAKRRYIWTGDDSIIKGRLMTTDMLRKHLERMTNGELYGMVKRWPLIPLTKPVEFTLPSRLQITISPYLVGLIIGDGSISSGYVHLTTNDEHIASYLQGIDYAVVKQRDDITWAINGSTVRNDLKKLGLLGHRAESKFVPDCFKYGSIETRWEMLRGLMDTDGYADSRGHLQYCSVSRQLAQDVKFIVQSLGGRATITEKVGSYRKDDGTKVECQQVYMVYIQLPDNSMAFNLPRKKERCRGKAYNGGLSPLQRRMVSIEEDGEEEAQCIQVDHPNGLYLTDDFIVTHNTSVLLAESLRQVANPYYRGLILRRTFPRLKDIIDRSYDMFRRCDPSANFDKQERRWTFSSGAKIDFGHCENEEDKRNYQGQEYHYMAFDQVEEFTESQYTFIIANCRSARKDLLCYVRCSANPGGVGHAWVHKRFINGRDPFRVYFERFQLPNGEWVEWSRLFIPAKVYDNKILLATQPMYIAQLMSLPEDQRRAMLDGDWNVFEGQYFSEWRPEKDGKPYHVIQPFTIPEWWKRFRSIDWGYNDHTCVLWYAIAPEGRLYVYKELYVNQVIASDLAQKVLQMNANDSVSYTAAPKDMWSRRGHSTLHGDSIADEFQRAGVRLSQADMNRIPGWQRIREFLAENPDDGKPWLQVFSTCKNLIRTLPTLIYDDNDKEDVADGGEDHAVDSLRYGCMTRPRPGSSPETQVHGTYHVEELRLKGLTDSKIRRLVKDGLIKLIGRFR